MSTTLARRPFGPAVLRRLLESPGAVVGLAIMLALVITAAAAPYLAPHGPAEQFREHFLAPPFQSSDFPLGTDSLGRDILTRLIYGARLSLLIGAVVTVLALSTGTMLGLVAAFAGGVAEYVTATRSAGAGVLRLMLLVVLPNCLAPLIVQATLGFSAAILDAAALGFLGLGAQPPTPEWGTMLADALQFYQRAWWLLTFPGIAILVTVMAFNLLGDGLRDALDPKLRK